MKMEEWRCVVGFEGQYAVSDHGNMMSMNFAGSGLPGILKQRMRNGYSAVALNHNKMRNVHRLVAEAFLGLEKAGMQVNHLDGDKRNNMLANLEWVTPSENMKHAFRTGLQSNRGENHSRATLTDDKVREIRRLLALGFKQKEVSDMMGVKPGVISRVHTRARWGHVVDNADCGMAKNQTAIG